MPASPLVVGRPGRATLLGEGGEALAGLGADPLPGDDPRGVPFRGTVAKTTDLANDRLRGAGRRRAGHQDIGDRGLHGRTQRRLAFHDFVDEPDPLCPHGVEPSAAGKQRARMRFADLRHDEWGDDGRQDPETRLGEPESGAALCDDEVRDGTQPHAATERRAVDPRDDRHRTDIDRLEHVGHGHRILFVALDIERHRRAHPGDIGTGAERWPVAGQHDRPQCHRFLARQRAERRAQLRDDGRIECVVDIGPRQRHAGDDPPRTGAFEADRWTHGRIVPTVANGGAVWTGRISYCTGVARLSTLVAMGPANPWSPNWRPDPTGRRAVAIRSSRRGALFAAVMLWPLTLLATLTSPGAGDTPVAGPVLVAALSWPGLALLGAGLAPAALGSRVDGAVAGLALAIGAPVAAVLSTVIGVVVILSIYPNDAGAGEAVGLTIRLGVLGAMRVAPLLALAVFVWVVLVRRRESESPTEGTGPR